uniref:Uncharacterized protein n=1 Tax=Rhizophora mucronata TaxID=61149 RepID=A0A2P2R4C6_RHIMU
MHPLFYHCVSCHCHINCCFQRVKELRSLT